MSDRNNPRVRLPEMARQNEIVEIKTLLSHPMESGQRREANGSLVPRKIIRRFYAKFDGEVVFAADWHPAIAANPYQAFFFRAERSGEFVFSWIDDDDVEYTTSAKLVIV